MARTVLRCPDCRSSVVLERDIDGLALACVGCSRRWTRPTAAEQIAEAEAAREIARLRADSAAWRARCGVRGAAATPTV